MCAYQMKTHADYLARETFKIELGTRVLYWEAFLEDEETISLYALDAQIIREREEGDKK